MASPASAGSGSRSRRLPLPAMVISPLRQSMSSSVRSATPTPPGRAAPSAPAASASPDRGARLRLQIAGSQQRCHLGIASSGRDSPGRRLAILGITGLPVRRDQCEPVRRGRRGECQRLRALRRKAGSSSAPWGVLAFDSRIGPTPAASQLRRARVPIPCSPWRTRRHSQSHFSRSASPGPRWPRLRPGTRRRRCCGTSRPVPSGCGVA